MPNPYGGNIKTGWKGQIDHVAIWKRALSDAEIERLSGGAKRIAALKIAYTKEPQPLPPAADLYQEKYRPQFHVTARQWTVRKLNPGMKEEGWINDVNGLIYHQGQYHLFAQRWARCWLHFVSKDLVHWTELQPAFWEERRFGTGVQSGTVVFDSENVSGLSSDPKNPPLVAFWSGFDNRSQCISYSVDHGLTWAKYAKNPYMLQPERDPKVFWYQAWSEVGDGALRGCEISHFQFDQSADVDRSEEPDTGLFRMPGPLSVAGGWRPQAR